ncbi:TPA: DUF1738 domain-containing protein [Serratia odorifera]|nr:DUF1738 domain-containing protein [Serratia odorifera]
MKKKSTSRSRKKRPERPDLYQQVTDKIIAAIERGTLPWRKPWQTDRTRVTQGSVMPLNGTTGNFYSGVNVLLLWLAAHDAGFTSNRWLTYLQADAAGGHVRAGEKATLAVVFKPWEKEAKDADGRQLFDEEGNALKERGPMLKPLYLFNVCQCDSLPENVVGSMPVDVPEEESPQVDERIQAQVSTMVEDCGVQLKHVYQSRAFYTPSRDLIMLPEVRQFQTEADYWSTLLHELVHSTGHVTRLNREGITSSSRKQGDPVYAFEELVAELGSAFLCARIGIAGDVQHDSYLDGWLKIMKEDKRALFRASSQARQATEFLFMPAAETETVKTDAA